MSLSEEQRRAGRRREARAPEDPFYRLNVVAVDLVRSG